MINKSEESIEKVIQDKKGNIGALTSYIKKRDYLFTFLKDECSKLFDVEKYQLSIPQMVWYYVNKSPIQLCICGEHKKWRTFKEGWRATCGDKECFVKQRVITNNIVYGHDNPSQNKEVKEKRSKTNIKKYGTDNPAKNKKVIQKISETKINKSEEEKKIIAAKSLETWNSKSDEEKKAISDKRLESHNLKSEEEKYEIILKRENTLMENYGVKHTFHSPEIKAKIKSTMFEKYGHGHHFSNKDIQKKRVESYEKNNKEKLISKLSEWECVLIDSYYNPHLNYKIFCKRSNNFFKISYTTLRIRLINNIDPSNFFHKLSGTSINEQEIFNFIQSNYTGEVINRWKDENNKEIDIYIPELNLGFEHNGVYYHNELFKEANFHIDKSNYFKDKGIKIIHIFEDDWKFKKDIVKSRILSLLQKNTTIYGRKCDIREVDSKDARLFFDTTHLQGFISAKYYLGLYFDNKLVTCMSFGSNRKVVNTIQKKDNYELYRFSNSLNCNVVGGASKLFKYFINEFKPKSIISYQDKCWGDSIVYKKLGFHFIHLSKPSYYYVIDKEYRKHRFGFRKDKLVSEGYDSNKTEHQIMLDRGIYRIYDCGTEKWEYIV